MIPGKFNASIMGTSSTNGTSAPLTILLVRAGRTDYDCQKRIQGTLDVPLSDDGRQQVLAAADELTTQGVSIDAIYSGPSTSVEETAEILGERLALKPKTIDELHNVNQGLWQGLLFDEVKAKQPKVFRQWQEHPESVCPPEGESLAEVRQRMRDALAKIAKKHKSGVVLLILAPQLACVLRGMLRDEPITGLCQPASLDKPLWEPLALPLAVKA